MLARHVGQEHAPVTLNNRAETGRWRGLSAKTRCITASVKSLVQRSFIHSIVRSDGDNPGPWLSAIPVIPDRDIHSLADNLKDDPAARLLGSMNHAFASIDAGGKLAPRFSQRFQ